MQRVSQKTAQNYIKKFKLQKIMKKFQVVKNGMLVSVHTNYNSAVKKVNTMYENNEILTNDSIYIVEV